MTNETQLELFRSEQYSYKCSQFKEAVRGVIASHNLDKDSQAGILLDLECELREESD